MLAASCFPASGIMFIKTFPSAAVGWKPAENITVTGVCRASGGNTIVPGLFQMKV